MPDLGLADWQQSFFHALLGEAATPYPQARFRIYERNIRLSLTDALRSTFPVVQALVGEGFFTQMARHFIAEYPPGSCCLQDYGAELAAFLGGFQPAETVPYLADVARLEWAWHLAYWCVDESVLGFTDLQAVPADQHAELQLPLHCSATLFTSRYAPIAVWQAHQQGAVEDDNCTINPLAGPEYVLVRRTPKLEVQVVRLSAAEWQLLQALQYGASLGAALESAFECDPQFDVQPCLASHIAEGSFAAIPEHTE